MRLDSIAKWEASATKVFANNKIAKSITQWKYNRQQNIEARRQSLKKLLADDAARYRKEIDMNTETTEQRKYRLMERANQLKEDRTNRRQNFANKMRNKQFRANCDDLRSNAGTNLLLECGRVRRQQVEERRLQEKFKKDEDKKWIGIWEDDYNAKLEREKLEQKTKMDLNTEIYAVIDEQVKERALMKQQMEKRKEGEAEFRKQQAERETARAVLAVEEELRLKELRREEAHKEMEESRRRKEKEIQEDAKMEQEILQRVLAEQQELQSAEAGKKAQVLGDIKAYMEYLERRKKEQEEKETYLEQLRQLDLEKQMAKQDQKWEKERKARENLLKEVYQERQEQVATKAAFAKKKELERLEELKILEKNREMDRADEERERSARLTKMAIQDYIRKQMRENELHKGSMREQVLLEDRVAREAEEKYQAMVQRELAKDLEAMKTGKAPAWWN